MKNLFRLSACLLVGAALPSFAQDSEEGPDPSSVHIIGFQHAGTGCPAGTVSSTISQDQKVITVMYDAFFAEAGPGIPLSAARRNCQLGLTLKVPQGWQYSLVTVDFRGYANLQKGVVGTQKASYYFSSASRTPTVQTQFRGPLDEDYHLRDTLQFDTIEWSPCGATRQMNINSQVKVNNDKNRKATGILTVDSTDASFQQIYALQWQRCTENGAPSKPTKPIRG